MALLYFENQWKETVESYGDPDGRTAWAILRDPCDNLHCYVSVYAPSYSRQNKAYLINLNNKLEAVKTKYNAISMYLMGDFNVTIDLEDRIGSVTNPHAIRVTGAGNTDKMIIALHALTDSYSVINS